MGGYVGEGREEGGGGGVSEGKGREGGREGEKGNDGQVRWRKKE